MLMRGRASSVGKLRELELVTAGILAMSAGSSGDEAVVGGCIIV